MQVKQLNGVTRYSEPILSPDKTPGENLVFDPTIIEAEVRLAMIYRQNGPSGLLNSRLRLAFSDNGRTFVPDASDPVMLPDRSFDSGNC